jgi:hypothetical protein
VLFPIHFTDMIVFLSCDIIALVVQGAGGGMIAGSGRGSDAANTVRSSRILIMNQADK